jgi:hypothetical protein
LSVPGQRVCGAVDVAVHVEELPKARGVQRCHEAIGGDHVEADVVFSRSMSKASESPDRLDVGYGQLGQVEYEGERHFLKLTMGQVEQPGGGGGPQSS